MSAKRWLKMFVGAVILALMVCAGFNMLVDPFGVFGDVLLSWDSYNITNNPRVAKLAYLDEHHGEYDSYIIGSSSAASYNPEELNEYLDARFYNLFAYGTDTKAYRDTVEYIVNHYTVKNILLNIGVNEANVFDQIGDELTARQHADASGENPLEFYIRYALGNPKYSLEKISSKRADTLLPQPFDVFEPETGCYDKRVRDVEKIGSLQAYRQQHGNSFQPMPGGGMLPFAEDCAESVAYIKALCEEKGVNLIVVFSPVYDTQWQSVDPQAMARYKKLLADASDYWDFSYSSLSLDPRYFYDATHFRNAVGSMILAKMFGNTDVYCPADFGAFVTRASAGEPGRNPPVLDLEAYTAQVPILMYHHFEGLEDSRAAFAQQLQALQSAGYHTVSFDELIAYVERGAALPEKPVCITFDDGYLSNYQVAYPILEQYGMKATIFVIGSSVGHKEFYKDTEHPITPHFDYNQANEMLRSGLISIQSHTFDMHQWAPYEDTDRVRETVSKLPGESDEAFAAALTEDFKRFSSELMEKTGQPTRVLAYPQGAYSVLSEVVLHELGVKVTLSTNAERVNTVVRGLPQSLYALNRFAVDEHTAPAELLSLLGQATAEAAEE